MNFDNDTKSDSPSFSESPSGINFPGWSQLIVPDLWQQEAINALRDGKDVVVQAPTGSGKTFIFEHWSRLGKNNSQAVYTVPTRALANDKLAEWRARGWNVGITTGDLSENLDAPIIVATLETQKLRLLRGEGPALLVVDEYQMIRDPDRGLNYELALAMAPQHTQLLLLSGSVANPQDIVKWFGQLGRDAVLIKTTHRPVPLEEVLIENLHYKVPANIRGTWPRLIAKALAEDLGPILIFAPRRTDSEKLAAELARYLPNPNPLRLSSEQRRCVGDTLARMLKSRICYHHSGLSYAARAGVIEPLTKAGQLRVVVATMGLAAGINFSLRTVALAADSYKRDGVEYAIRPDEVLQMFGRAGRRGIDQTGYVLTSEYGVRLHEAYSCHLSRSKAIDWSALLCVMQAAKDTGKDPFSEALRVQSRLFTASPVLLGIEESLKHPDAPCGLKTDTERARRIRKPVTQFLNSHGEWHKAPLTKAVPLKEAFATQCEKVLTKGKWKPALTEDGKPILYPALQCRSAVETAGVEQSGIMCEITPPKKNKSTSSSTKSEDKTTAETNSKESDNSKQTENSKRDFIYGRRITLADIYPENNIYLEKYIRRLINWSGRQVKSNVWKSRVVPRLKEGFSKIGMRLFKIEKCTNKIIAYVDLSDCKINCIVDDYGVALFKPATRETYPPGCDVCPHVATCQSLSTNSGAVLLWKRLGLINPDGSVTPRGRIASFFSNGAGLAIAAAIEDVEYPLEELVYDLANLDAGFRFAGDENRWGGRLAYVSKTTYKGLSADGYLEYGIPPEYGYGAKDVVEAIQKNPEIKYKFTTPTLGVGDIDRIIIEWRSRLRQVAYSPTLENPRWTDFQKICKQLLHEVESPTLGDLPPLEKSQTRRLEHTLILKKH